MNNILGYHHHPFQVQKYAPCFGWSPMYNFTFWSKLHEIWSTKYDCFDMLSPWTCVPKSKLHPKNDQNPKSKKGGDNLTYENTWCNYMFWTANLLLKDFGFKPRSYKKNHWFHKPFTAKYYSFMTTYAGPTFEYTCIKEKNIKILYIYIYFSWLHDSRMRVKAIPIIHTNSYTNKC